MDKLTAEMRLSKDDTYKAQTERMIATSMKPKAETTEMILVQNKPTRAGVGIIKEEKSQIKIAR